MISTEEESSEIKEKMKTEEDALVETGNVNSKDKQLPYTKIDPSTITEGSYSKLYYLFQARIIQVQERIEVITTKLNEITAQFDQIEDETQLTEL